MPPSATMRTIHGFDFDPLVERVGKLEEHAKEATSLTTEIRLDVQAVKTTIRFWGIVVSVAVSIGAPLLGGLAAWLVLRVAQTPVPTSTPPRAAIALDR